MAHPTDWLDDPLKPNAMVHPIAYFNLRTTRPHDRAVLGDLGPPGPCRGDAGAEFVIHRTPTDNDAPHDAAICGFHMG